MVSIKLYVGSLQACSDHQAAERLFLTMSEHVIRTFESETRRLKSAPLDLVTLVRSYRPEL
jgi:hypothetical protein